MTTKMRARLEARPSSYARLDAEGRAAFDAYDGPVSCGPPSDLAARDAEIAGLKVRAEKAEANYAFMVKRAAHLSTLSARVVEALIAAKEGR